MKNYIGNRYGRLVVVQEADRHKSPCGSVKRRLLCECDCGNTTIAFASALSKGLTISCGCYQKEQASKAHTTHGRCKKRGSKRGHDKLRNTWALMIDRCHNKNSESYSSYGERGITVCESWRKDFDAFAKDMGPPPSPSFTIERVDNNKGYTQKIACGLIEKPKPEIRGIPSKSSLTDSKYRLLNYPKSLGLDTPLYSTA